MTDALVKVDEVWIRLSDISLVRPEMIGPIPYQKEHTRILLRNGFEFELEMSVNKFFEIAGKAMEVGK
jgi:hypothetical protein